MASRALILTLGMEEDAQARFDAMRTRHFPPDRNVVPAHVSLFHALPGEEVDTVAQDIQAACAEQGPFRVQVGGLRSLGRGVAYELRSPELVRMRAGLAKHWQDWLTPQDRQGFRPHMTIQNKAAPEEARALLAAMKAEFVPFGFTATGLLLWRYLGGPWDAVGRFPFAGAAADPALPSGGA